MKQNEEEFEDKNDAGYYTPKNILNPAMFRLAEITRALSQVNMEIEQEAFIEEPKRNTVIAIDYNDIIHDEKEKRNETPRLTKQIVAFNRNKDLIGKLLLIALFTLIGLFLITLILSWPS